MQTARRLILGSMALATSLFTTACSHAWPGAEPLWTIYIHLKPNSGCVSNFRYQWPGVAQLNRNGARPAAGCNVGMSMGTEQLIPDAPFEISWVDAQGASHKHSIPISNLLGSDRIGGNTLLVQVNNDELDVYLIKPVKGSFARGKYTEETRTLFSSSSN